ncbi:MAG: hypothetical protein OEW86_01305 [Nitrosopumilus sp.]|nr:hypothetical protein [Nitrosopumilus sp.]MDH5416611.1 hypothetical protein [Nitrosopumilus sp.]MDH5555122.1 hypothetical protein [Nitrosopumilus sp.]
MNDKAIKCWVQRYLYPAIFSERFEEEIKDILSFEVAYKIKFDAIIL